MIQPCVTCCKKLIAKENLSLAETSIAFDKLMSGQCTEAETAALLMGLAIKGVSVDELVGVVRVMRNKVIPIPVEPHDAILDTCGTGGASKNVFGISTATGLLLAACGQKVVKHGNRAASGKFGSADVLEVLGLSLELSAEALSRSLKENNFCFAFARNHNPAMKHVAPVRTALGVPTIFNLCGPLTNPASPAYQIVGVFTPHLLELIPQALKALGTKRAWAVLSEDGLGELSTTARTQVTELIDGHIRTWTLDATDLGLPRASIADFQVADAHESAKVVRCVLEGKPGPARDIVVLNAAGGLVIAGKAKDLHEGLNIAKTAIDSGNAAAILRKIIAFR